MDGFLPSPEEGAVPTQLGTRECKKDIECVDLVGNREGEQTPAYPAPKPMGVAEPGPALPHGAHAFPKQVLAV